MQRLLPVPAPPQDPRLLANLRGVAEAAKIKLSTEERVVIRMPVGGGIEAVLTRQARGAGPFAWTLLWHTANAGPALPCRERPVAVLSGRALSALVHASDMAKPTPCLMPPRCLGACKCLVARMREGPASRCADV